MSRWLPILIAVLLGISLGLVYGWVINPVLMVAEAYHIEEDPALAARRLAVLGSDSPALIAGEAYNFAQQSAYNAEDLALIQELAVALQTWQPVPGTSLP
jgi:hypothetical protein